MAKGPKIEPSVNEEKSPEVEQELSQVATNPKQNILILVGIVIVFGYLFFSMFFSGGENKSQNDNKTPIEAIKPTEASADSDIPAIPKLPTPPKLEDLTPPPPPEETAPLPVAPLPTLPVDTPVSIDGAPNFPNTKLQSEDYQKRLKAKRKSSIVLIAGTPPTKTPEQLQQEADFTFRGDMTLMLGRGKLIDAVIETAVNTDFGGEIRAVITRDIYSEWGKNILLPKGSRVFGNYTTGINGAYGSIAIEWIRIDLANGYTLNLSGTGVDALGRKGTQGRVDQKFRERFSNAVLRSAFNIGLAKGLDAIVKPQLNNEAAASRSLTASNIKSISNGIFTQTTITDTQKRVQICAAVLSAIEDKTTSTFNQIQTACNELATNTTATETAKLTSLMSTINVAADGLLQNTTASVEETKSQAAAKTAYNDISDTLKSFVEEQEFKPTITIDQGTPIKIYVNKDYKFPKNAIKYGVVK